MNAIAKTQKTQRDRFREADALLQEIIRRGPADPKVWDEVASWRDRHRASLPPDLPDMGS